MCSVAIAFVAGLFVGAFAGILCVALCKAANSREDE